MQKFTFDEFFEVPFMGIGKTKVSEIFIEKRSKGRLKVAGAIVLLISGVIASYSGIFRNDFVNYDDAVYITQNPVVVQGLSWAGFKWAFSTTYASNWHPLSWLSHMLDVQLFGLNPAGHHFTGLLLHIIGVLLLFGLMYHMTGGLWRSALVAALFALHPLHVESVAWAAERKDVLCAAAGFAALWAYAYYTRCPGIKKYLLVVILFALGLMAKPMLVSFPLVLLLLDYWPLERLAINKQCIVNLVAEKVPLLLMAIGSAVITIIAQQTAIGGFNRIDLPTRVANAIVSYCIYMGQIFWPVKLAVIYPYKEHPNPVTVALCAALLIAVTVMVFRAGRRKKYLLTGWLWYLVTLVPVIGIIQVGSQAHADRYTYIPGVGIFMIVSWGLKEIADRVENGKKILVKIASVAVIPVISGIAWKQVGTWKNDFTLFSHAAAVTKDNYIAYNNLGFFFERTGRKSDALTYYLKALDFYPDYTYAHYNLGLLLTDMGRTDEAIVHYQKALELNPDYAKAHNNLGLLLSKMGRTDEALVHYRKAFELNPDHAKAHNDLGALLEMMGRTDEALAHYRKAVELNPDLDEAHNNLGLRMAKMGRTGEALDYFQKALEINPNNGEARYNLSALLEKMGRTDEALDHHRKALEIRRNAIRQP
jgi:protein O-mannosyl-transferase